MTRDDEILSAVSLAMAEPMNRNQLIDALWAGDVGEVEFAELALGLGMEAHEIGQVMSEVREEDGTF